jgi:hypothetical protein
VSFVIRDVIYISALQVSPLFNHSHVPRPEHNGENSFVCGDLQHQYAVPTVLLFCMNTANSAY